MGGGGASGGRAPPLTMGRTSERARPGDHIWRVGSGGGAGWVQGEQTDRVHVQSN